MKKKLALLAAAALCVSLLVIPASAAAYPVWAEEAMGRWAACEKLDLACPADRPVTRGGATALLASVMDYTHASGTADAVLSRQEAAVLVADAFGFTGAGVPAYTDAAAIAPGAANAVFALQKAGVMQGSGGCFRPAAPITYAELVKLADNALLATNPITGMRAKARGDAGVLTEGAKAAVNDGKFTVGAVTRTESGYALELLGTAALVGERADAVAPGQPLKDGKWMGLRLQFSGLVRADAMQYSDDGEHWAPVEQSEAIAPDARGDSIMVYLNGAATPAADGREAEKTSTLHLRQGADGRPFTVTFHYTPGR